MLWSYMGLGFLLPALVTRDPSTNSPLFFHSRATGFFDAKPGKETNPPAEEEDLHRTRTP